MNELFLTLSLLIMPMQNSQAKEILLTPNNTINFNTQVDEQSVKTAMNKLVELNTKRANAKYPIYLVLNSPGGSIMSGIDLITFFNTFENVETICIFCASMAHGIAQGLKGNRLATKDNIMMSHRAAGGFKGQFNDGEVESQLQLFKKVVESLEIQNANRIGISLSDYKQKVKDEWWTYGEDSKSQHVIDNIVSIKCDQDLLQQKTSKITYGLFGPIGSEEVSDCPLMK